MTATLDPVLQFFTSERTIDIFQAIVIILVGFLVAKAVTASILSLLEKRLTPDLYTVVIAAKQIGGDQVALHVAETSREYLPLEPADELGGRATLCLG